jgi:hypothetical protein
MSSLPLWLSIEPARSEVRLLSEVRRVRLLLSEPSAGTSLKARLPPQPADGRALMLLLEALSLWYGLPLHAVLDADAEDVRAGADQLNTSRYADAACGALSHYGNKRGPWPAQTRSGDGHFSLLTPV